VSQGAQCLLGEEKRAPLKTQDAQSIESQSEKPAVTAEASHPALAVRPEASSLPASAPRAGGAVVPALQAAFPQEEECAGAANARSAEEFATAEPAHSGWAQADCSAGRLAECSIQADCSAVVSPDGLIPGGYSAALLADGL
jgi:hypothetical protein